MPKRLIVVGVLFCVFGVLGLWQVVLAVFDQRMSRDFAVFLIPVGIGILVGRRSSRRWMALWVTSVYVVVALLVVHPYPGVLDLSDFAFFMLPIGVGLLCGMRSSRRWATFWIVLGYVFCALLLAVPLLRTSDSSLDLFRHRIQGWTAAPFFAAAALFMAALLHIVHRSLYSERVNDYITRSTAAVLERQSGERQVGSRTWRVGAWAIVVAFSCAWLFTIGPVGHWRWRQIAKLEAPAMQTHYQGPALGLEDLPSAATSSLFSLSSRRAQVVVRSVTLPARPPGNLPEYESTVWQVSNGRMPEFANDPGIYAVPRASGRFETMGDGPGTLVAGQTADVENGGPLPPDRYRLFAHSTVATSLTVREERDSRGTLLVLVLGFGFTLATWTVRPGHNRGKLPGAGGMGVAYDDSPDQ